MNNNLLTIKTKYENTIRFKNEILKKLKRVFTKEDF
jgi:hypothetical protein